MYYCMGQLVLAIYRTICTIWPMQMNHSDIINLWPTLMEFASDMGVDWQKARGWKRRNSIPTKYWPGLIESARKRKAYVSPEILMMAAAQRRAA